MYSEEAAAQHPGMTHWYNPTSRVVKVEIFKGPPKFRKGADGRPLMVDSGVEIVSWQPGDERWLNSDYDAAIQGIDAHTGQVVHGLAPMLVKNGAPAELHPALDVEEQKKKDAVAQAAQALAEQHQAAEALLVAQAAVKAAETAKREQQELAAAAAGGKRKGA